METLTQSAPFQFNTEEAFKNGFYVSGTTGCGKSDVAMYCADELHQAGAMLWVFDPSQDWLTRYPIANITKFGSRLTTAIIDSGLQATKIQDTIFDCSTLTTLQFQDLADRFSWLIFNYQARLAANLRKQMFVIFEETHILLPEGSMKSRKVQNIVRLATVGRNFKIRIGVITQFAAMTDKNIIRFMNQRWFGWTDEFNDVHRIGTMVGQEEAEALKTYKSGEFLYCFPAKNIQEKMSIAPYLAKRI